MELDNELLFFVETRVAYQYEGNFFTDVYFENVNSSAICQAVAFWRTVREVKSKSKLKKDLKL